MHGNGRNGIVVAFTLAVFTLAGTVAAQEQAAAISASNQQFTGWGFGAGLSVTADLGDRDRVTDATVDVNGIVRVNKKSNVRARLILETHYFFPYTNARQATRTAISRGDAEPLLTAGWGPFVAAQPGEDDIVQAAGIGIMFGWRRPSVSPQGASASFNLGIGFMVDPNTKVLGDEFKEDEPAPIGPDGNPLAVRFQETDQSGVLALASFSW